MKIIISRHTHTLLIFACHKTFFGKRKKKKKEEERRIVFYVIIIMEREIFFLSSKVPALLPPLDFGTIS